MGVTSSLGIGEFYYIAVAGDKIEAIDFSLQVGYKPISKSKEQIMYIDPNTGGILFQALAGIVAVISGALFLFSRKIREGIARLRRRARKDEEDETRR
jgi:LPXTG-motif cell wall-anchored protein